MSDHPSGDDAPSMTDEEIQCMSAEELRRIEEIEVLKDAGIVQARDATIARMRAETGKPAVRVERMMSRYGSGGDEAVETLVAFGVPLSSSRGRPKEFAEMLEFTALAARRRVIQHIQEVWYASDLDLCLIELAQDTRPDIATRIRATAYLTLSTFIIEGDHFRLGRSVTNRYGEESIAPDETDKRHGRAREAAANLLVRVVKAGGTAVIDPDDIAALIAMAQDDEGGRWPYETDDAETRERILRAVVLLDMKPHGSA